MGWGDSGLSISLGVANFHKMFAMMSGRPALIERWCQPGSEDIGCWAVTEPDHGSDSLTFTEPHFSRPDYPGQLHRPQGRRLLRHQRAEVRLGVERHDRQRSPPSSAPSMATRASRAGASPSSTSRCRA